MKKILKNFITAGMSAFSIPVLFITAHLTQIEEVLVDLIGAKADITLYLIVVMFAVIWGAVVVIIRQIIDLKKANEQLLQQQQQIADDIKPLVSDNSVSALKACVVHHRTLKTWERIRDAQKEIILHAAYYPKYGYDSDYSNAFRVLMENKFTVNVTVVITDISALWAKEFGKILRYEYDTIMRFEEGINSSIAFFKKLKEEYPGRVRIITSSRLPLMPFVIVDDDILVGHYCHAETPAPNGLWMHLNSDKVSDIIEKMRHADADKRKEYILKLTDEEKALSRYIEDVFDAINHGKEI